VKVNTISVRKHGDKEEQIITVLDFIETLIKEESVLY